MQRNIDARQLRELRWRGRAYARAMPIART